MALQAPCAEMQSRGEKDAMYDNPTPLYAAQKEPAMPEKVHSSGQTGRINQRYAHAVRRHAEARLPPTHSCSFFSPPLSPPRPPLAAGGGPAAAAAQKLGASACLACGRPDVLTATNVLHWLSTCRGGGWVTRPYKGGPRESVRRSEVASGHATPERSLCRCLGPAPPLQQHKALVRIPTCQMEHCQYMLSALVPCHTGAS
jgi:hypothetical protein